MGLPVVGSSGRLSRDEEERRRLAASRIPAGHIHPNKAFTAGFLLLFFAWASAMYAYSHPESLIAAFPFLFLIVGWILFYVGWSYDFLLFQQLDGVYEPSKTMGVLIAFTGPVFALIHWIARPSGY